ncbi:alpha/beta hydrolase family protein [Bradyrhizobium sp. McL0615]|uniref:alpha/beta hydrolase family protein n=1 Tax=Bradyrhizobium sp. McL0615 TaxID=3415673 RepID=UPI003CE955FB
MSLDPDKDMLALPAEAKLGGPKMRSASPCYSDAGWLQWPDDEAYSFQFMRMLGAAQEGASTISECFFAARLITPGDDESWHEAWKSAADINRARGDEAHARGGFNAATSNWLRASNYYRCAELFMDEKDPRREFLLRSMRRCSRHYLEHISPRGEVVKIPYQGGRSLEGYFISAPGARPLMPVVVCLGGIDLCKDELLCTMRRSAAGNGLSLLLIDLPGCEAMDENRLSPHIEASAGCWVDYLLARGDIDPSRIALYGDGLGSSLATRIASRDHRFAAAVCDGGLWDRHELIFAGRIVRDQAAAGKRVWMAEAVHSATMLKCPSLMTIGQHDYIAVENAIDVHESCNRSGAPLDLKVFSTEETAASPGHIDNPTLAKEFVFDWLRRKLGSTERIVASVEDTCDCAGA